MVAYLRVTRGSEQSRVGYIWRTETRGLADGLDVGVREREESKMTKGLA